MGADLRTRLKALVEEWRREAGYENMDRAEAALFKSCARELAALLAESEPITRTGRNGDVWQLVEHSISCNYSHGKREWCNCTVWFEGAQKRHAAESEPREPDVVASAPGDKWVGHVSRSHPGQTHYQGDDCPGGHASVCGYCGAPCEACNEATEADLLAWEAEQEERETQPVLKLGHEFHRCWNEEDDPYSPPDECCCGEPREAH